MKHIFLFVAVVILLGGCNKPDLALINSVKTFESRWQNLNEKLTFVDRNLSIAHKKYPSDLQELGSFVSKNPSDTASASKGFELEYKRMMLQKDKIELVYKKTHAFFETEVKSFNDWNRQFMKNKFNKEKASADFANYQTRYNQMDKTLDSLKQALIENTNIHNNLTRDKAFSIGNYNNFHLDPH